MLQLKAVLSSLYVTRSYLLCSHEEKVLKDHTATKNVQSPHPLLPQHSCPAVLAE